MRAIVYRETGGPEVFQLVERAEPQPGPGEVVVRVALSGVNPTDWKVRKGSAPGKSLPFPEVVPNQDGAGTIVTVGAGVDEGRVGQRVWLWDAAWKRADGTAQEMLAIPEDHAVPLPDAASFELGASLGIPARTAHRALTVGREGATGDLGPGALEGVIVLVAGGAGAVGHAAIELANWAGARVITTVSSEEKAQLAKAAGAHHVVNYRTDGAADEIRKHAPDGVNLIIEVAPVTNAELDAAVLGQGGTVVTYASEDPPLSIPVRPAMTNNLRYLFLLVYTMPEDAKGRAVRDVSAAVEAGALRVGEEAGLPLHRYPLERTADAHVAVEQGAVGKVLVEVTAGSGAGPPASAGVPPPLRL